MCGLVLQYINSLLFARVRFQDATMKNQTPYIIDYTPSPNKQCCNVFPFFAKTLWQELPLSFSTYNIMWYGWNTCSNCWTILMLPPTDRSKWCIFILGETPCICKATNYKPAKSKRWVYLHFTSTRTKPWLWPDNPVDFPCYAKYFPTHAGKL
jgi:hypothetical protein